jgi:hypothetical protein
VSNGNGNGLRAHHQTFICQAVARYEKPLEIAAAFLQAFGDEFPDKQDKEGWILGRIDYYAHHGNAKAWQVRIAEWRTAWLEGVKSEVLANKRCRVREMAKDVARIETRLAAADETRSPVEANELVALIREKRALLDQIAAEAGDKMDRHQHSGQLATRVEGGDWVDRVVDAIVLA